MKRLRWIVLICLVVVAAAFWFRQAALPVNVAVARRGPIQSFVDERAKTRLPHVHRITMPQAGRILAIELEAGTEVSQGQIVAQIHPADLDTAVQQQEAQVAALSAEITVNKYNAIEKSALEEVDNVLTAMDRVIEAAAEQTESSSAKMELAQKRLSRAARLIESQAISTEALEQRQFERIDSRVDHDSNVLTLRALEALAAAMRIWPREIREWIGRKELQREVLQSRRRESQISLDQLLRDRKRGTLKSPVNGVVLRRFVSNERVLPAGEPLLEIGRLEDLEVEADVLSQDVVDILPGNRVDIYGPAIGEDPVQGRVARIYPAGFLKLSSLGVEQQRVKVIIRFLPGQLDRLRRQGRILGTSFRVRTRIITASKDEAVVVPRNAIFRGPRGGWQLFVVQGGRASLRNVEVGLMNDDQIEVLSGVEAGETVVLAPEHTLHDGARVTAQKIADHNP